ncbi:MAG TPA: hypothetical protein PKD37_02600 [Oligoflexia bacterium]|nr:hypothetical protein [Oligoflexia bacterium]HMP26860.1 hypothetical protein [Oligoflexia bacterium]
MRNRLKNNNLYRGIVESGHSLLELLSCLSLFTILLGIATPSFQVFGKTQRFNWEVVNLMQLIERASFESQLRGGKYRLILSESEARLINESGEEARRKGRVNFKYASIVLESQEKSTVLSFFSSGVATPATILLKRKDSDSSCKITISLRSRVLTDCLKR